jgi:hypothetical protein
MAIISEDSLRLLGSLAAKSYLLACKLVLAVKIANIFGFGSGLNIIHSKEKSE